MDKHIRSLYDDTQPVDDTAGDTLGSLHTEPWQAGPRRWRGWPVLGIGVVALGLILGMNHYLRRASSAPPADVVAAAPQTPLPAPSIDRSTPADTPVDKPGDKPVDRSVDKPVGKSVDNRAAEAGPAPKPAAAVATRPKPAEAPVPKPNPREPVPPEPAMPPSPLPSPLGPPEIQPDPPQVLPQPMPAAPAQAPTPAATSGK